MSSLMFKRLALVALTAVLAAPLAAAEGGRNGDHRDRTSGMGLTAIVTRSVADGLRVDLDRCARVAADYQFDCYSYAFRLASNGVDANPAYGVAQAAFDDAERSLRVAVRDNVDRSRLPKLFGFQIFRPVLPDAEPQMTLLLGTVLADVETRIRMAPDQVGDHFQVLADAVAMGRPGASF